MAFVAMDGDGDGGDGGGGGNQQDRLDGWLRPLENVIATTSLVSNTHYHSHTQQKKPRSKDVIIIFVTSSHLCVNGFGLSLSLHKT